MASDKSAADKLEAWADAIVSRDNYVQHDCDWETTGDCPICDAWVMQLGERRIGLARALAVAYRALEPFALPTTQDDTVKRAVWEPHVARAREALAQADALFEEE